jgi:hypothetical protein
MKGDFSQWNFDKKDNFNGVLHQQGRVLLDGDWNAAARITNAWQDQNGRDVIGPGVAAVPAEVPESFKVQGASVETSDNTEQVVLKINPGRVWADGLLTYLPGEEPEPTAPVKRVATYLEPPIQDADISLTNSGGFRDAVILEVWREAVNGFQMKDKLIEPALGGPDTTERVHTAMAFRLLRLEEWENCENIRDRLKDDPAKMGTLKVSLQPSQTINGECPVEEGGGYTGFEHHLYRIEIAQVDREEKMFKWSRFNGGLVGRGKFENGNPKVNITDNFQAITTSGLNSFYLEAVEYNESLGHWQVTYGAEVTLNSDNQLELGSIFFGNFPGSDEPVFFRLWDGIKPISEFPLSPPAEEPKELKDGIRLEFDDISTGKFYRPGDFWTFEVRAGEITNKQILIGKKKNDGTIIGLPPEGILYHRVPLAILNWNENSKIDEKFIHDCRQHFIPLTDLSPGCCKRVEPGENLHWAVREIIDAKGGCICLMPGDHYLTQPLDFTGTSNIRITGFGRATRLHVSFQSRANANTPPFILRNSKDIAFESFSIISKWRSPIFSCQDVKGLEIKNMILHLYYSRPIFPIIFIKKGSCYEWNLENNTFIGPIGLKGYALHKSSISGNYWSGVFSGIELKNTMDIQVKNNRFFGRSRIVPLLFDNKMDETISSIISAGKYPHVMDKLSLRPRWKFITANYVGMITANAIGLNFSGNQVSGGRGVDIKILENGDFHGNWFKTKIIGANLGLVNGMTFNQNRIGLKQDENTKQEGIVCQLGLRILNDAVNCKITDNAFLNVREGIVFETDTAGKKEITRDFSANLVRTKNITPVLSRKLFDSAVARTNRLLKIQPLLLSSFFRVGKCERTLIQGNHFNCEQTAVQWSGTKNIVDFRIINNAFIGCQETAIRIEPDDRIFYFAEPVDTKVRLIEKNRFFIYAAAIRSTIGAVRVENNDIRVLPGKLKFIPPKLISIITAENVYISGKFLKALKDDDIPAVRMMNKPLFLSVEKNPAAINTTALSGAINNEILPKYEPNKGDSYANAAYTFKAIADLKEPEYISYLPALVYETFNKINNNLEKFVINLGGIQNRVTHNNIYSNNYHQADAGIVFHFLSGEVRDNEIVVPRIALLMNGKAGKPGTARRNAEIVGNSLRVTGVPQAAPGTTTPVYSLSIPFLNPGHLAVTGNLFDGSVKIGSDPISSMGFRKKDRLVFSKESIIYNPVKLDPSDFSFAINANLFTSDVHKEADLSAFPIYELFLSDPHKDRPVIQFADNRVVRGWLGISHTTAGAYLSKSALQKKSAVVINLSHNVIDLWAKVSGKDLVIVGNHSQLAIKYREGTHMKEAANIPDPQSF